MSVSLWIVFTAGIIAAFNPCGIAMLPSYISYLIGADSDGKKLPLLSSIVKGIGLGLAMTIGFLIIFVSSGILINIVGRGLTAYLPVISLIIAVILVLLGLAMLFEKHLPVKTISFQVKPGKWSIFLYGIAYALASLGCTLPAFLLVIVQSINHGTITVVSNFIVYSVGMGLVVTTITAASLVSRQYIQQFLSKYIPVVKTLSAIIIFLTGLYLIYYWTIGAGGILF
jgi:cytochrome c-type biogenesis protein